MTCTTSLVRRRAATLTLSAALVAGSLTACGNDSGTPDSAPAPTTAASVAATPLTIEDPWVKAVEETGTDLPMSALFGTLTNASEVDITVTAGSSDVAESVELHEVVKSSSGSMQMQPKAGGFTVPAGGTQILEPGGDHVMLIGLEEPLKNGSTVTVDLETSAGPLTVTAPVRTFAGGKESYDPSPSAS